MISAENVHDTLGRSYGYGTLFHDDLISGRDFRDHPGSAFHVFQVRCPPFAVAEGLRRRVHRNKYQIGLLDRSLNIGGEEQIFPTAFSHHFVQARFIYRQLLRIPLRYSFLALINDGHLNFRAFQCNNAARRATHVTGSDATDFSDPRHFDSLQYYLIKPYVISYV